MLVDDNESFTIQYIPQKKYIYIKAFGLINIKTVENILIQISKLSTKYNCKKAMIDLSQTTITESYSALFNFKNKLEKHFPRTIKTAVITSTKEKSNQKKHSFIVDVSHNRGWNIKLFYSFKNAEKWILEEEDN